MRQDDGHHGYAPGSFLTPAVPERRYSIGEISASKPAHAEKNTYKPCKCVVWI